MIAGEFVLVMPANHQSNVAEVVRCTSCRRETSAGGKMTQKGGTTQTTMGDCEV